MVSDQSQKNCSLITLRKIHVAKPSHHIPRTGTAAVKIEAERQQIIAILVFLLSTKYLNFDGTITRYLSMAMIVTRHSEKNPAQDMAKP